MSERLSTRTSAFASLRLSEDVLRYRFRKAIQITVCASVFGAISGCEFVDAGGRQGNSPPLITAANQSVHEGALVVLDGSETKDDFGEIVEYRWEQTAGSTVELSGVDEAQASFIAPRRLVPEGPETLSFVLTAIDRDGASANETFEIEVRPINQLPQVDAGEDQSVVDGANVLLAGVASDTDGSIVSSQWEQIAGAEVMAGIEGSATLQFVAPVVKNVQELRFRFTATDNETESGSDEVSVTVEPGIEVNVPPVADAGPDHDAPGGGLIALDGRNSFDPDGEIVSYLWSRESGPRATLWRRREAVAWLWVRNVRETDVVRVRLRVTDDEGASGVDFVDVFVSPSD